MRELMATGEVKLLLTPSVSALEGHNPVIGANMGLKLQMRYGSLNWS